MISQKFSLERILHYREHQKEVAMQQLAAARQSLLTENDSLHNMEKQFFQAKNSLSNMETAEHYRLAFRYLQSLQQRIIVQKSQVNKLRAQVDNMLSCLLERERDCSALKKLKENHLKDYHHEFNRQQQLILDEIAQRLHFDD